MLNNKLLFEKDIFLRLKFATLMNTALSLCQWDSSDERYSEGERQCIPNGSDGYFLGVLFCVIDLKVVQLGVFLHPSLCKHDS